MLSSGGKVIGVATAAIKESQNLNFAVSARHLAALLTAEPQENTFASFFAKQKDFVQKESPLRPTNAGDIVVWNFAWTTKHLPDDCDLVFSFTFTVFNGSSRPIRDVVTVLSFLNTELEPVDTRFIRIAGTIAPESAFRANGSVDGSVVKLNHLPNPEDSVPIWDFKPMTYKIGTNVVSVKWTGSDKRGHKSLYLINGKPATSDDRARLLAEARSEMRVMRVLSFEYAD